MAAIVRSKRKFKPNPAYIIKVSQDLDRDGEKLQQSLLAPPPKPTPVLSILGAVIVVLVASMALSLQPPEADQPLNLKMSYSLSYSLEN